MSTSNLIALNSLHNSESIQHTLNSCDDNDIFFIFFENVNNSKLKCFSNLRHRQATLTMELKKDPVHLDLPIQNYEIYS